MSRTHETTANTQPDPPPPAAITQQVRQRCADGYRLYDAQDYSAALRVFYQAWLLIPKPQTDYAEAGWVLTAIGDSYYRLEQFEPGTEALHSALCCPLADKSPFVHLRLGQCLYGLQRLAEARQCLFRAYQGGGSSLLTAEPARYRELIADLLPRD